MTALVLPTDLGMSRDIPLAAIAPDPDQPRRHFDQARLDELAASLAENGQAVPIMVRPADDGFMLVHGERRWRAARQLGWETIRAEVNDVDRESARWLQLVENIQRSDLSPIEEARAFHQRLGEDMTQRELGERIGKSQSYIAQKLRLLKLPAPCRLYVDRGLLSEGHARQLLRLEGIYHGVGITLRPGAWTAVHDEDPIGSVRGWLITARPEDEPWNYSQLVMGSTERLEPLRDAARAFAAYVEGEDGAIPCWVLAAFWFSAIAVARPLSVAALEDVIDGWRLRILSAVLWWKSCKPKDGAHFSADDRALFWCYRSDLRHAGLWPLIDTAGLPADFIDDALQARMPDLLPSEMQPWGKKATWGEEYSRLHERLRVLADRHEHSLDDEPDDGPIS